MRWDEAWMFRRYRRALGGNLSAHRALVRLARLYLKHRRLLPPGLNRYFLRAIEDPADYAARMRVPRRTTRGPPGLDSRRTFSLLDDERKVFFGQAPTEKNALMIAYLHSKRHPINEATTNEKESAVVLLNELTGRSTRQLQRDYYRHVDRISRTSLSLGEALYKHRQSIARRSRG